MRINNYGNTLGVCSDKNKINQIQDDSFDNAILKQAQAIGSDGLISKTENIETLKQDFYNEIEKISNNPSPHLLSKSVSVSDEALKKMDNNSEFKAEVMSKLSEEFGVEQHIDFKYHQTTTVTENGVYTKSIDVYDSDSVMAKTDKNTKAIQLAEGAIYYKDYSRVNNSMDSFSYMKIWQQDEEKQSTDSELQMRRDLFSIESSEYIGPFSGKDFEA